MKVEVDQDDTATVEADDRGRINLGVSFANKTVEIAILDVKDDE